MAVLRVDDRDIGGSSSGSVPATSADFAHDVRVGVAFLRARPEIAPKRIGLISSDIAVGTVVRVVGLDRHDEPVRDPRLLHDLV